MGDEQTLPSKVWSDFNGNGRTITTAKINPRKYLRPSEILKSNKMVENIIHALKTQFIHSFHAEMKHDKLYNLDSGYPAAGNRHTTNWSNWKGPHGEVWSPNDRKCPCKEKLFDSIKRVARRTQGARGKPRYESERAEVRGSDNIAFEVPGGRRTLVIQIIPLQIILSNK